MVDVVMCSFDYHSGAGRCAAWRNGECDLI